MEYLTMQTATADSLRDLRRRILDGGEYSLDEIRDAIRTITNDRVAELSKSTGKTGKKRAPAVKVDLDDLLTPASPKPDA